MNVVNSSFTYAFQFGNGQTLSSHYSFRHFIKDSSRIFGFKILIWIIGYFTHLQ